MTSDEPTSQLRKDLLSLIESIVDTTQCDLVVRHHDNKEHHSSDFECIKYHSEPDSDSPIEVTKFVFPPITNEAVAAPVANAVVEADPVAGVEADPVAA
jgi:hypothetical protein